MSFFLTYFDGDVLWNYGFSYAISRNEIPYLDFNMILTPIYPFLMSLILRVNDNMIFFYLENALIITIMFSFLFKMYDYKAWLLLILLVFPIPAVIFPSYNLFLILLIILLLYLEKNKKNDYLIGFIIGISILTKQTVGVCLLLPSLIYFRKDLSKIIKRFVGLLIPCTIFFLYLIITKSIHGFLDLCLFGLFDFSTKNQSEFRLSVIIGLILLLISFFIFFKNRKDIKYFYVLCFSSIMIPLFDFPHIEYYFFVFILLFIDEIKINKKNLIFNSLLFSIAFVLIFFFNTTYQGKISYPNHYNNFNYRLLYNKNNENEIRDKMIEYLEKNDDKQIVLLGTDAYFYKIACDLDITYFDLINYGNHGYNGTDKMKKMLDKLKKGTIIIVDTNETFSSKSMNSTQFNKEIAKYGIKISKEIDKIGCYTVYIKEW